MRAWHIGFLIAVAIAAAVFALLTAMLLETKPAEAHHGQVQCGGDGHLACIATTSTFVERIVKVRGEATYCFNQAALQYPGFRDQMRQSMTAIAASVKGTAREVPYPSNPRDTSCTIRHDMRWDHPCGGCGAWIYLLNFPMVIEYNAQAGYTYWFSTNGHELGHGYCLLDEHYDKVRFVSWILTYGVWAHGEPTVMDFGTHVLQAFRPYGVHEFTEYDLARCEETTGLALLAAECTAFPCWDGDILRFADGRYAATNEGPCWTWYDDSGAVIWGSYDANFKLRHTPVGSGTWVPVGQSVYPFPLAEWITAPGC